MIEQTDLSPIYKFAAVSSDAVSFPYQILMFKSSKITKMYFRKDLWEKPLKKKYHSLFRRMCDSWYFNFAVFNFEALQNVIHLKSYIYNLLTVQFLLPIHLVVCFLIFELEIFSLASEEPKDEGQFRNFVWYAPFFRYLYLSFSFCSFRFLRLFVSLVW